MERGSISVKVWGEYACYSRPEFKAERVSYPVITPSAARGVLEAIFWKPEMRYQIRRIGVLALGSQMTILRNEIEDRQGKSPIVIEEKRQQRTSLILKDVAYLIEAVVVLRHHATDPLPKYLNQVERRIVRGQYHHAPCLGMREFAANFGPSLGEVPPPLDLAIGTMFFDRAFVESTTRAEFTFVKPGRDRPVPGFAHALFIDHVWVTKGWLNVPAEKYQELYRLEGDDV